ncbi:hypothetical protein Sar04_02250 [Salinispora arenicola]|uniref:Uncharacterized protein n=1 Tax=Salinispora arenicola TaxID=168697 RepID=A0ABQ4JNA2_SALAC|nr:hypothetical protein Sar04_02250 [Salinispora arenicola]
MNVSPSMVRAVKSRVCGTAGADPLVGLSAGAVGALAVVGAVVGSALADSSPEPPQAVSARTMVSAIGIDRVVVGMPGW